jgi:hypothetical protein
MALCIASFSSWRPPLQVFGQIGFPVGNDLRRVGAVRAIDAPGVKVSLAQGKIQEIG